jgi:hypothetical protein
MLSSESASVSVIGEDFSLPPDGYQPPDWLRYVRAVYFEGYDYPLYPHINFDAKQLVDAVVRLGGDTLRFQPIGWRAYYPSKAYPVHQELGGRDLINEVSRECRNAGLHLYCYTGYGVPMMEVELAQQPQFADWILRDPEGNPSANAACSNCWRGIWSEYAIKYSYYLCIQGDAYRQGIRNVARELCAHDIDGVYFDAPSEYREICFCEPCRRNFKKFTGMDLDRLRSVKNLDEIPSDADMKALLAWYAWANQLIREDLLDFRKIIHGSGKFMLCHNGSTWRPGAVYKQNEIPEGFMVEYSDQSYERLFRAMMGASSARPRKQLPQMYMGCYDVQSVGEPPNCMPWAGHVLDLEDGDEVRMEGFVNLAGGDVPIYAVANRLMFGMGDGSPKPAQEVFALMQRMEPFQKDSVPVSYVSIVPTRESLELWRTHRKSWNVTMSQSFLLAMLDQRIGVDVNPSTAMTDEWLQGQRVIALCGASIIKEEDARRLANWVKEGGGLLATYDSGLYDENGDLRQEGGALREILGVEMRSEPSEGQADAYYRLKSTHPALAPYQEGNYVMGDPRVVQVSLRPGATLLAECWNYNQSILRGPAIVLNHYGKGKAIYVSGSLEINYPSSRVLSLRRMLGSMVRYLADDAPLPFHLTAPVGVYGILRRAPNGDLALWILANVGFKDAAVGRMRQDYVPVSNVEVRIRVPEGRKVQSVELVREGQSSLFTREGDYVVITLPVVHIAELVHLALV